MKNALRESIMAKAHAREDGSINRPHVDHRAYRPTAAPGNPDWSYTQRAQQDNPAAPTPARYDTYKARPVNYYKTGPQKARPPPYPQGLPRTAQNIAAQWNNTPGSYGQRPPNVTVYQTEQGLQAHQGLSTQARSPNLAYQAQPMEWKPPQYLNNHSVEHSGHRPRGQSMVNSSSGHFRGGCSSSGHSNRGTSGTEYSFNPVYGRQFSVHSMNAAPSEAMSRQLTPPVREPCSDSSIAQQCFSMGAGLRGNTGLRVRDPTASQFTRADNTSKVPPSTSAWTVPQQSTSSSQSLSRNQLTPGHYVSSSGMTQHGHSLAVNAASSPAAEHQRPPTDLFITPRDKTPPATIEEIKQWLEKGIGGMLTTNNQVVGGNQIAGKPNRNFDVEKMNILQPGRSQGQPRDRLPMTSDGSREAESALRLEIQPLQGAVVKAVNVAPPPVAVVTQRVPSQPIETEGRVHGGSASERLLSISNRNGKVTASCTKNIILPDDSAPQNNLCAKSIPKSHVSADHWIDPRANKLSVPTECQTSSSPCMALAEGSHGISDNLNKAEESVLNVSSVAVIHYTLYELRKLVASLESSSVPRVNQDNTIDALLNCFWDGDIKNIMRSNYPEFAREMAEVTALKPDENRVVLSAVDGISLQELLDKCPCPSLTQSSTSSSEKFRSSWLNVNEKLDDLEPSVAWPLCFTPETAAAEPRSKEHAMDTSDVEMHETAEMESGRTTDMEAQRKMEIDGERNEVSEAVMETETPGLDATICDDIKLTLMSPEDAQKMFDQLQNDSSLLIDFSVLDWNNDQTNTGLDEEGIMGQEEQNTADLLSMEDKLLEEELSSWCPSLV